MAIRNWKLEAAEFKADIRDEIKIARTENGNKKENR
jgi:hypothetical protein